jgi:hypothetical protein
MSGNSGFHASPVKGNLGSKFGYIGCYKQLQSTIFKEFKYISDSRHSWREDAEKIISSKKYMMLYILTHPFWYTKDIESCRDKLFAFITSANKEWYKVMDGNFTNLKDFVQQEEV